MRKHRPFVKRDIIETEILTGRKFSLVVFKIHRSIFSPLWQGQQRSRDDHFLVTYVTRGYENIPGREWRGTMIIFVRCNDSRCLFSFLFSFFYFLSKRTIDWTGTTVDACTECLGFVPRKRDAVDIQSVFEPIFEFDDRDSYYLSPLLYTASLLSLLLKFEFPPPIALIARKRLDRFNDR